MADTDPFRSKELDMSEIPDTGIFSTHPNLNTRMTDEELATHIHKLLEGYSPQPIKPAGEPAEVIPIHLGGVIKSFIEAKAESEYQATPCNPPSMQVLKWIHEWHDSI